MTYVAIPEFVVIDDDPTNNLICRKILQLTIPEAVVHTFTDPEKGIDHLMNAYSATSGPNAIVFLDINMPVMTGWEVLDRAEEFQQVIKDHLSIYIFSSSVAEDDHEKANNHHLVTGYVTKSLSQAKLSAILATDPFVK